MSATVIRLPCTHKMIERANTNRVNEIERMEVLQKVLWNAQAALKQLEKGNTAAARRFVRHIVATTEDSHEHPGHQACGHSERGGLNPPLDEPA